MAYNILIVDDSATTRCLIKRTIQIAEVPIKGVYEAINGKAALETLECVRLDLVLADLNMPEMNGFEMTRLMMANPDTKDIPVILVSAEPSAASFAEKQEGVRGCLRKPFTPEDLRDIILKVLGESHATN